MKKRQIIDLHQDFNIHIKRPHFCFKVGQTDMDQIFRNKVKIFLGSCFPCPDNEDFFDPSLYDLIESDLNDYLGYVNKHDKLSVVRDNKDIDRVMANDGSHGIILHIESINIFTDNDWDKLEKWYEMGWRSLGPVWNLTNPLGGGVYDPDKGLTDLGKKLIHWLKEHKIIVDFAHMSKKTFLEVADILDGPIFVSHAGAHTVCPNDRNCDDEQLKLIAETGGVIGVFLAANFVSKEDRVEVGHLVDHIDHIKKTIGIDHVALGTDFGGLTGDKFVEGLTCVDDLHKLWDELEKRGYSEEEMEKIAYKNAVRVLKEILD